MTKPLEEVFTIDNLISWLETKNPDEEYDYMNNYNCLFSQFLRANGFENMSVGGTYIVHNDKYFTITDQINNIALDERYNRDETFGDALKRAKKIRESL